MGSFDIRESDDGWWDIFLKFDSSVYARCPKKGNALFIMLLLNGGASVGGGG